MRFSPHQFMFVAASVLTVGSFLGTTAYSQSRLTALDTLSDTIAANGVPSIELLGQSGVRLQRLRHLTAQDAEGGHPARTIEAAIAELDALDQDIGRYLQLTPLPGERALWTEIHRNHEEATRALRASLRNAASGERPEMALLQDRAEPALERATTSILAAMEFDSAESERLARDVRSVREQTTKNIIYLNVVATAIASITALIAFRAARDHDMLLEAHNTLLQERVTELDRFAGRAAHDILNPLATVKIGLALVERQADERMRDHVTIAQRALGSVQQLVEGLLEFARSSVPDRNRGRSSVDRVLEAVAADCAEAARSADVELEVQCGGRLEVPCSIGVLTSIVENLTSNAIKYMGSQPVRRVTLRAAAVGEHAQIEVEDTGPGIPRELQGPMFEPFVRGSNEHVAGMGLGLATVKRLVEAHGGTVRVDAGSGGGTVFRVELPLAPAG